MATYLELAEIGQEPGYAAFYERLRVATVVKATALLDLATPTQKQVDWAISATTKPSTSADSILWYVIAANKSATTAAIVGADDAAVQAAVDAAVDTIVTV